MSTNAIMTQSNPLLSSYLRTPPIVGPWYSLPHNEFNHSIDHSRAFQKMLCCKTQFKSLCDRTIHEIPAIDVMPKDGKVVQKMGSLALANVSGGGPFTGVDTEVVNFVVPIGYDGVLNKVVFNFTGTGFVDGTGSIAWRVKIGNHYARDLGNVLFTYGSLQIALITPGTGIELVSGQTVSLIASIPVGSPVGGADARLIAGGFGWVYPRH